MVIVDQWLECNPTSLTGRHPCAAGNSGMYRVCNIDLMPGVCRSDNLHHQLLEATQFLKVSLQNQTNDKKQWWNVCATGSAHVLVDYAYIYLDFRTMHFVQPLFHEHCILWYLWCPEARVDPTGWHWCKEDFYFFFHVITWMQCH